MQRLLILLVLGEGALALPLDSPRPGSMDTMMAPKYDQNEALEPITGLDLPRNEFTPLHLVIRERDKLRRLEEIKFKILSSLFPEGQVPPRGSNPSMILPSTGFPPLPPIPQDVITKTPFYMTCTNGNANGSGIVYPPTMAEFQANDEVSSGGDDYGESSRRHRDLREKNEGGFEDFKLDDDHPLRQILRGISRSIRNRGMKKFHPI